MPPSPTTNQSPNSALPVLAKSKDMFNLNKSDSPTLTEVRGLELREELKTWKNLAASEARIELMKKMIKENISFPDIEELSKVLTEKFRSKKFKSKAKNSVKPAQQVPAKAMLAKLADEECYRRELIGEKNRLRRQLGKNLTTNSKPYRKTIKHLREEARLTKAELQEKFKKKIIHLQRKYRPQKEDILRLPEDLEEFSQTTAFHSQRYDQLQGVSYETKVIGEINLSQAEKSVLSLPPKYAILPSLHEGGLEMEQEASLAKL